MNGWHTITGNDTQRNDPCGQGSYGAPRNNASGIHMGEDILVSPGQEILSPINGYITREGIVYSDDTTYKLIEIEGEGQKIKIMFAFPYDVEINVVRGQVIGVAQKITDRYPECGMLDHLHIELFINGQNTDPRQFLYSAQPPIQTQAIYYFKSNNCPPCVGLGPIVDALAQEYTFFDWVIVDYDQTPEIFAQAQVQYVPTIVLYDGDDEIFRIEGGTSELSIRQAIETYFIQSPPQNDVPPPWGNGDPWPQAKLFEFGFWSLLTYGLFKIATR